jgi:hypothetical protein
MCFHRVLDLTNAVRLLAMSVEGWSLGSDRIAPPVSSCKFTLDSWKPMRNCLCATEVTLIRSPSVNYIHACHPLVPHASSKRASSKPLTARVRPHPRIVLAFCSSMLSEPSGLQQLCTNLVQPSERMLHLLS